MMYTIFITWKFMVVNNNNSNVNKNNKYYIK